MKPIQFLILLVVFSWSCGKHTTEEKANEEDFIVEKGFIIKTERSWVGTSEWFFVSAKKLRKKNWIKDFNTENLKNGVTFDNLDQPNFPEPYIEKHFDTLQLPNLTGERIYTAKLMLFPVQIKYKFGLRLSNLKHNFHFEQDLGNQLVRFQFVGSMVQIYDVIPLAEPKWPITECQCERRENDENDYLYKICLYQKERESKYSDVPCSYGIRSIEKDSLEGKAVIKLNLTCCYMGDIAYIDPETKEVIKVRYGPR